MTNPLPPYGTAWCCAKCTSDHIDDSFRAQRPQLAWHADGDLSELVTHGHDGPEHLGTEHECLLRTCRDCGWAWLEACADAERARHETT